MCLHQMPQKKPSMLLAYQTESINMRILLHVPCFLSMVHFSKTMQMSIHTSCRFFCHASI